MQVPPILYKSTKIVLHENHKLICSGQMVPTSKIYGIGSWTIFPTAFDGVPTSLLRRWWRLYRAHLGDLHFCTTPRERLPGVTWVLHIKEFQDEVCNFNYDLSRLMKKPTICIGENKDADQLRGNREAD